MAAHRLPGIARIEHQRALAWHRRSPVAAEFQAEIAALQRMHAVVADREEEPQHHEHDLADAQPAGRRAPHDRLHVLGRVEPLPGRPVGILPFGVRHGRVMHDPMIEVVLVHVGVHPRALAVQDLVVLRARQGGEDEELEDVDRQLALDDLDVALDGLLAVVGEAQDVAGIGDAALLLPGLQHGAVVGDAVLLLLGGEQAVGVDVLQADEHARHAGAPGLLDEARDLVAQRVHLDRELDVEALAPRAADQAVEERLPVPVAREVVVGDEEAVDALRHVLADDRPPGRRRDGTGSCGPAR